MRIEITKGGIYGADGEEIAVGTTFDVKEEPTAWAGRYTVLKGASAGKEAVTAKTEPTEEEKARADLEAHTVDELKKIADDEKVDLKSASAKGDIIARILEARAK